MSFGLAGKSAIVTGAANGIGAEIARHFAAQGARVMLADMDEDSLDALTDELRGAGHDVASFAGDLREKLTIANLLSATIDAFDRVDILVNASRQMKASNPLEPREDAFEFLFKQNVLANLRLTQLIAKRMIQQAEDAEDEAPTIGAIVNLSSIASERTHPDLLGYSVACAALNQMTRSLAVALAKDRIRVNAIAIGSVLSAGLADALEEDASLREDMEAATPLGRIAEAVEVAEVAQFLASASSNFVTGQIISVDGGRTLIDPVGVPIH